MAAPILGGIIGGVIGGVLPALLGKLFGKKKQKCCQQGQQFNNFPMQQPGGCPGQFGPQNPFQAGFQQGAMLGEINNLRQEIAQMRQMLGGGMPGQCGGFPGGQNPYQAGYQAGLAQAGGGAPNPYQSGFQAGMQSEFGGGIPGFGGFPGQCGQMPGGFGGYGGQQGFLGQGGFGPNMAIGAVLGSMLAMLSQGGGACGPNQGFQSFTPMLGNGYGAGMQVAAFARF
jgi:hypothetical protein